MPGNVQPIPFSRPFLQGGRGRRCSGKSGRHICRGSGNYRVVCTGRSKESRRPDMENHSGADHAQGTLTRRRSRSCSPTCTSPAKSLAGLRKGRPSLPHAPRSRHAVRGHRRLSSTDQEHGDALLQCLRLHGRRVLDHRRPQICEGRRTQMEFFDDCIVRKKTILLVPRWRIARFNQSTMRMLQIAYLAHFRIG